MGRFFAIANERQTGKVWEIGNTGARGMVAYVRFNRGIRRRNNHVKIGMALL